MESWLYLKKAKDKLDNASEEIKGAIQNLGQDVADLGNKLKERLQGTGEEMGESIEELTREVNRLSEKVKDLVPKRRKKSQLPERVDQYQDFQPGFWEQPFMEFRKAADRLFEEFFRSIQLQRGDWHSHWGLPTDYLGLGQLRVDMDETDEDIRITAELPGVDKDNIDIRMTEQRISIRGEKKEHEDKKDRGYYTRERSHGSFQRDFYLPCEVDAERVEATLNNGILTIKLPKSAAAREQIKKISVRTE
jgi:HSP20 family protein